MDGPGPDPRRQWRRGRRDRAGNGNRRDLHPRSQDHAAGHRWRRPHLRGIDQRLHQHRRRPGHGRARGHPAAGHGVLAVPPHRRGRRGRAADRRLPRRRRDPAQQRGRAFHGTLRAHAERPGAARLRQPLHGPGDQGRPWLRPEQGLRAPEARPPGRRNHPQAPALGLRDRRELRQRRHHARAHPRRAHHPLPDGRHPDQHQRPGRHPRRPGQPEDRQRPVCRGRMLLRERARRQPPGHQLAAGPAGVRPRGRQPHRAVQRQEQDAQAPARRRRRQDTGAPGPPGQHHRRRVRAGCGQRPARGHAAARRRVPHPGQHGRRRGQDQRHARARRQHRAQGQVQGVQHRAHRSAGSREPDGVRAGHHDLGRRPPRVPRRAHRQRLRAPGRRRAVPPGPQRRRVDETHAVGQRHQHPVVQARQPHVLCVDT
eukprot:Opistho-1_new@34825